MIFLKDFLDILKGVAQEYFVFTIQFVPDFRVWAQANAVEPRGPLQFMALIADKADKLTMFIQSGIEEDLLDTIINGLEVRWSLKDNVSMPSRLLNSAKKKVVYCFLKEYARTVKGVGGDELLEDEWSIKEMDKLGFFKQ